MPGPSDFLDEIWELAEFCAREALLLRSFLEYLRTWPDPPEKKWARLKKWHEDETEAPDHDFPSLPLLFFRRAPVATRRGLVLRYRSRSRSGCAANATHRIARLGMPDSALFLKAGAYPGCQPSFFLGEELPGKLGRRTAPSIGQIVVFRKVRPSDSTGLRVRKVGFEPTRLAAPPPQDGASASSATSAQGRVRQEF
jgi:hypothetical protein